MENWWHLVKCNPISTVWSSLCATMNILLFTCSSGVINSFRVWKTLVTVSPNPDLILENRLLEATGHPIQYRNQGYTKTWLGNKCPVSNTEVLHHTRVMRPSGRVTKRSSKGLGHTSWQMTNNSMNPDGKVVQLSGTLGEGTQKMRDWCTITFYA